MKDRLLDLIRSELDTDSLLLAIAQEALNHLDYEDMAVSIFEDNEDVIWPIVQDACKAELEELLNLYPF